MQITTVMRSSASKGSWLAGLALISAWSRPGRAQAVASTSETERTYSVDFSAAPGCPDVQAFDTAVRLRSPSARPSEPASATLRLKVVLAPKEASRQSELTLDANGRVRIERFVAGASCLETMEAMAVITAVALDAGPAAIEDPAEKNPAPSRVAVPEARPITAAIAQPREPLTRKTHESPSHVRLGFLGLALLQQNVGEGFTPGGGFGIEVASTSTSPLSPSIRWSGFRAASQQTADRGTADLRLLATRVELCPLWLYTGSLAASACPVLDVGQLRATGKGVQNPRERNRLWFGAGLELRFELHLTTRISWGISGALEGRFPHDRFVFSPTTTVYQVSEIDGDLSTSLVFFLN